ncbi:hypothetical protein Poli38472_009992 [Pythium oligandrum]|uniref:TAZ-type domain-containing protein n=1 Tax=Pythium oligandrum TaxID=41045 RepID=A0A8K1C928_PYTOL|nr:hypothetical protein Poli38472_009992 [Pythium oligandrum]|eukprot:TMW58433.1 hypothetical protein Poli38472_009992 [Pythium oligandrum]
MFDDMAWTDDQPHGDWEMELQRVRYGSEMGFRDPSAAMDDPFYLSNGSGGLAARATGVTSSAMASNGPTMTTLHPSSTLTTSASCPSFTSLYDINGDDLLSDIPDGEPLGELFMNPGFNPPNANANATAAMGGYDYVLQFQQQHQDGYTRQYPHQPAQISNEHLAAMHQSRRQLHMSASFTSLSSMETEYKRRLAKKRKPGYERPHKHQRHKSFDSTTTSVSTAMSPATSMEFTPFHTTSTFESTPEGRVLDGSTDPEMIGFSIDDFPSTFTSDSSWPTAPPPLSLAAGLPFDSINEAPHSENQRTAFASELHEKDNASTQSEMEMLFSENERVNVSKILDAIRDFDSPVEESESPKPARSSRPPPSKSRPPSARRKSRSPQLRPSIVNKTELKRSASSSSSTCVRERINSLLDANEAKPETSITLDATEQAFLAQSPLFAPEKTAETAGSLWLLLHSSQCQQACTIAGCDVMRRVIKHCRSCEAELGKCRDPCNEAKAMLLHYATCSLRSTKDDKQSCALCAKLEEIDRTHNAIKTQSVPSPQMMAMGMPVGAGPVLIAPQPTFVSPTHKPATGNSKHVPIQPNPLPTASNPMGLMGSFPQFSYSLALYLEQTSSAFRAEVKARVEKRVTAAAGQDLIQHMQKKTRLRSLDDIRSEARAIVLGEMERELHYHMQNMNWPSGSDAGAKVDLNESGLPSYLLSVAAAGFAAFYAQQATLQAAAMRMSTIPPFTLSSSAPSPQSLSRQSSTGGPSTPSVMSLAPRNVGSSVDASPTISPKETIKTVERSTKDLSFV